MSRPIASTAERDTFALSLLEYIRLSHWSALNPEFELSISANTSGCPTIHINIGKGEVYNITITRARS